jgi:hypothetical protein
MSRSYKKVAIVKDGGHERKKNHARAMRCRTKQMLHVYKTVWKTEDEPQLPIFNEEITHGYDFCDWWILIDGWRRDYWGKWWTTEERKKYLRK